MTNSLPSRVRVEEPTALGHRCEHMTTSNTLNVTCAICGPLPAHQDRQVKYIQEPVEKPKRGTR